MHIIGENRESTILDADADATDEAAVVIIKEVEDVTFKNFTLANGYTEGHGCIGGGGLLVTSDNMFDISEAPVSSTPIIENLIIENSNLDRAKLNNELEKIETFFVNRKIINSELIKLLNINVNDNFNMLKDAALSGNNKNTNKLLSDTAIENDKTLQNKIKTKLY